MASTTIRSSLPPLTEKIDRGAAGGHEFERLMNQLLLVHADKFGFLYAPTGGAGGDGGVDGLARDGIPGVDGVIAFQFKWLWDDIHKGANSTQIRDSFKRAAKRNKRSMQHWILVTPRDLKPSESKWLETLTVAGGPTVHHWGQAKIEQLLGQCPPLLARYYPHAAHHDGYECADFRELAQRYREKVTIAHGHLKTAGLPAETLRARDSRADLRLRDLFIPLRLVPDKSGAGPEDLARVLAAGGSAVVLADPGMGKSMLLAYLALLYAGGAALEGFSPAAKKIPLFISLREFVQDQKTGGTLSFLSYLEAQARKRLQLPRAHWMFFEAALRMGEAVVLLDGLDEVGGEGARQQVATMIRAFRADFPSCSFWITSRIYGYTSSVRLSGNDFAHHRIDRLDDEQVNGFIARWYAIQIPDNPTECDARTTSLCKAIHRTRGVRRLAHNPLLLTLMAFLHHGERELPRDRVALYEKCVEMLLRTWQTERRQDLAAPHALGDRPLDVPTQKVYLARFALFVQEKSSGDAGEEARGLVSRSEALDCLEACHWEPAERIRPGLSRSLARDEMDRFLNYLGDETGLLIHRGGDQLSFIHLSFQEYLAAWVFTCTTDTPRGPAFFAQHLGDPAWEEVLLLRLYIILKVPGGGGTDEFDAVVGALLHRLEDGGTPEGWLTLTRALRDDLAFRPGDQRTILQRALRFWLDVPTFKSAWFTALEEVSLFAERARGSLREALANARRHEPAPRALASLHLEARLFGFPEDAAAVLRTRSDLSEMLPDIIAFIAEPTIVALLAEKASVAQWSTALQVLDGPPLFRRTLHWATKPPSSSAVDAALGILLEKILADLRSRAAFAAPRRGCNGAELFERTGRVLTQTPLTFAKLPLSGARALSVDLPREEARPGARMLCDRLARERIEETGEGDLWAELSAWTAALIRDQLNPFLAAESPALVAIHSLASTFVHIFSCGFGREIVAQFIDFHVHGFGSDFGRTFGYPLIYASDFGFGGGFGKTFGPEFVRKLGRAFFRDFGNLFVLAVGRQVDRADSEDFGPDFFKPGWEARWDNAIAGEEKNFGLLKKDDFWWAGAVHLVISWLDPEEEVTRLDLRLENPLALPFVLADVLNATALHRLFMMSRHITMTWSDDDETYESLTEWARRNPVEVYGVAFAWEEYAKTFLLTHESLHGAEGALFLAHAAYVGLMTGLECSEPVWKSLLEKRKLDDPRMRMSWAVYELCHFRDQEKNVGDLEREICTPSAELRSILEVAGLVTLPQEAIKVTTQSASSAPPGRVIDKAPFFSWLHLSDVHFGHKSIGHQWDQNLVLDALRKDIAEHMSRGAPASVAIMVTGDIAFSGATAQYDSAKAWLLDVATCAGITPDYIFLVPGNHDVDRDVGKSNRNVTRLLRALRDNTDDLDTVLADPGDRVLLTSRMAHYLSFVAEFPSLQSPDPLFWSHSIITPSGLPVRLIGFNTALVAADDLDKGKLRLGKKALVRTLTNLPDNELTLILSHHPFRDNWLADQSYADSYIKGRGRIHLSGHVHEADSEESRAGSGTSLLRISAGAVHGDKLPPGIPASHGYSFAAVVPGENGTLRLRVWPRRWSEKNKRFAVDTDNTTKDRPYAEHTLPGMSFKR